MRTELWKPGIVSVAQDGRRETRETPAIHVTRAGTPFAEKAVCPGATSVHKSWAGDSPICPHGPNISWQLVRCSCTFPGPRIDLMYCA